MGANRTKKITGQTKFVVILENMFILVQIIYVYYYVYNSNKQTIHKGAWKWRLLAKEILNSEKGQLLQTKAPIILRTESKVHWEKIPQGVFMSTGSHVDLQQVRKAGDGDQRNSVKVKQHGMLLFLWTANPMELILNQFISSSKFIHLWFPLPIPFSVPHIWRN